MSGCVWSAQVTMNTVRIANSVSVGGYGPLFGQFVSGTLSFTAVTVSGPVLKCIYASGSGYSLAGVSGCT